MRLKTPYQIYENVKLYYARYIFDNKLYISLYNEEHPCIAKLTTCLDDIYLASNETYLDVNNCPWVIDFIRDYKLGELTGKEKRSGNCVYPVAKFDMDALEKYAK